MQIVIQAVDLEGEMCVGVVCVYLCIMQGVLYTTLCIVTQINHDVMHLKSSRENEIVSAKAYLHVFSFVTLLQHHTIYM